MDINSQARIDNGAARLRRAWNEHRLLCYAALLGVVGGLGSQLFVLILDFAERLLLIGLAGYRPPEPGTLNPEINSHNVAEVFEQFPELLAVAIIRDQQVQLPRGSSQLQGGDQLLIAASETTPVEAFKQNEAVAWFSHDNFLDRPPGCLRSARLPGHGDNTCLDARHRLSRRSA